MLQIWTRSAVLLLGVALAACGGSDAASDANGAEGGASTRGGAVMLTGAGATFPYPIYSRWFSTYSRSNQVRVNYQSIGSGGGIRQLTEGTVDFGASDAPMNEEELDRAPGTLHVPTVIGAVAVAYNLPGLAEPLRLNGDVLSEIFSGRVTRWNDARVQALNPGTQLPARDILVVHRTDGSGTTFVFTEYLSAVSPTWRGSVGTGKSVRWPTGLGAKGNEGVAGQLRQTEGSIGYIEDVYAQQNDLATAAIQNAGGEFVRPTVEATSAAAAGAVEQVRSTGDFRISIIDADAAGAYPISAFTYLLVPSHMEDCGKARALAGLVEWALTDGSEMARELGYAPLPGTMAEAVLDQWAGVTCGSSREPVAGAGA